MCLLLSPTLDLFDWDWATMPVEAIEQPRHRELPLPITASGTFNAFLVFFRLRCDDDEGNTYDSGPENARLVAWDQSVRYLPTELVVKAGEQLRLGASHDIRQLLTLTILQPPAHMLTKVGHPELVGVPQAKGLLVAIESPRPG